MIIGKFLNASSKDKKYAVDINDNYNFLEDVNKSDLEEQCHDVSSYSASIFIKFNEIFGELLNSVIREDDIIEL